MARSSQSQARATICDSGLQAATARNSPVADQTPTVSPGPGLPCTFATAPENTQG